MMLYVDEDTSGILQDVSASVKRSHEFYLLITTFPFTITQ